MDIYPLNMINIAGKIQYRKLQSERADDF